MLEYMAIDLEGSAQTAEHMPFSPWEIVCRTRD